MITQKALDIAEQFIKLHEGCSLKTYLDVAGIWTDGYGNTKDVEPHGEITQQQADYQLAENLHNAEVCLLHKLYEIVTYKLNDNQNAALICFVFNAGAGNWRIWQYLNQLKFNLIPQELMRFDHARVNGKLVQITGLYNRRKAEVALWSKI